MSRLFNNECFNILRIFIKALIINRKSIYLRSFWRKGERKIPSFCFMNIRNLTEEQILRFLEDYFQEGELADCFVTDLQINGSKIAVFVDSDSDMGFDKCRKISRFLEAHFDETKAFGEKYLLEVSSPGIGNPLKFKRQYRKNIGRKVEITTTEGPKVPGVLKEVNDKGVVVEYEIKVKEGNKKVKKMHQHIIADEEIEKIIVKVSF